MTVVGEDEGSHTYKLVSNICVEAKSTAYKVHVENKVTMTNLFTWFESLSR